LLERFSFLSFRMAELPIMPWRAVVYPRRSSSSLRLMEVGRRKPNFIWGSSRPWEFTPFPERFPTNKRSVSDEPSVSRKISWRNYASRSASTTFEAQRKISTISRNSSTTSRNTPRLTETNLISLKEDLERVEPEPDTYSFSSSSISVSSEKTTSSSSSPYDSLQEEKPNPSKVRKKSKRICTPEELRRKKLIMKARQVLLLTDDGSKTTIAG